MALVGCGEKFEIPPLTDNITPTEVDVTFNFKTVDIVETRSLSNAEEVKVNDVNLYFTDGKEVIHHYLTSSSTATITLPIKKLQVYAIANRGYDIGHLTAHDIAKYRYETTTQSDIVVNRNLFMTHKSSIDIVMTQNITIEFTKVVAKLEIEVELSPSVESQITLKSLRLCSVPYAMSAFESSDGQQQFGDYSSQSCYNGMNLDLYMLENCAGENRRITSQTDKSSTNAPANATYIEIVAQTSTKDITYKIYLGANNTSDFNVIRNNIYKIHISIDGINSSDKRVTISWKSVVSVDIDLASGSIDVVKYFSRSQNKIMKITACISVEFEIDNTFDIDIRYGYAIGDVSGDFEITWCLSSSPFVIFKAGESKATQIVNFEANRIGGVLDRGVPGFILPSSITYRPSPSIMFWYFYPDTYISDYTERTIIIN